MAASPSRSEVELLYMPPVAVCMRTLPGSSFWDVSEKLMKHNKNSAYICDPNIIYIYIHICLYMYRYICLIEKDVIKNSSYDAVHSSKQKESFSPNESCWCVILVSVTTVASGLYCWHLNAEKIKKINLMGIGRQRLKGEKKCLTF